MKHARSWWRGLFLTSLTGLWTAWIIPQARGVPADSLPTAKLKDLQGQAEKAEAAGQWDKAGDLYAEMLRQDRSLARIRQRLQDCQRRSQQVQRHRDASYRKDVLHLPYSQALQLYEVMLNSLQAFHVEKTRAVPTRLFRRGLEEFRFALRDGVFLSAYLPQLGPKELRSFLTRLARTWGNRPIRNLAEAVDQVRDVAMLAQKPPSAGGIDLNATVVVLEFACGACTALDEYTFYLTPGQYNTVAASLSGGKAFVGVGIELCVRDGKLFITRVLRGSPADLAGLKPDDQITRINKRATADLTPEAAMDLLKGETGTAVELSVFSLGMERLLILKRQKLIPRSVEFGWLWQKVGMSMDNEKTDIGYIQISHFQKTTPQELDNALMYLREGGLKALVLDLRGNRGGSFEASVECARRFLASGVIVTTKNQHARLFRHLVRTGNLVVPLPKEIPVVVLVDGDTASAAEVLAGALKDNGRARLVGQTTFGKGCSQRLLQLTAAKGGVNVGAIRITVAKFFSPSGEPYTGRGITPHIPAERHLDPNRMDDNQLFEARNEAQRLVRDQMAMNMNG